MRRVTLFCLAMALVAAGGLSAKVATAHPTTTPTLAANVENALSADTQLLANEVAAEMAEKNFNGVESRHYLPDNFNDANAEQPQPDFNTGKAMEPDDELTRAVVPWENTVPTKLADFTSPDLPADNFTMATEGSVPLLPTAAPSPNLPVTATDGT